MGNALTLAGAVITLSDDQALQMVRGNRTSRPTAALPATATQAIFTVTGRIMLMQILGEVTTVIQTQACNLSLEANPTATGASVALCAVLNISADVVGALYGITGTAANAMVDGLAILAQATPVIIQEGTIDLVTSATNTGAVKWDAFWIPLDAGATLVAA